MSKLKHESSDTSFFYGGLPWASPHTGTREINMGWWRSWAPLLLEESPAIEAFRNDLCALLNDRDNLLPLGTLGLKGRNTFLKMKKKPMVPLCYLPKGRRPATAGQMFYLELNIDKERKRTETCNVAVNFLEGDHKKRSRRDRRRKSNINDCLALLFSDSYPLFI